MNFSDFLQVNSNNIYLPVKLFNSVLEINRLNRIEIITEKS